MRTHNLDLARNFLLGALALSPSDPLVLNEVVHGGEEGGLRVCGLYQTNLRRD